MDTVRRVILLIMLIADPVCAVPRVGVLDFVSETVQQSDPDGTRVDMGAIPYQH